MTDENERKQDEKGKTEHLENYDVEQAIAVVRELGEGDAEMVEQPAGLEEVRRADIDEGQRTRAIRRCVTSSEHWNEPCDSEAETPVQPCNSRWSKGNWISRRCNL